MLKELIDLGGNAIAMYYVIDKFSSSGKCYLSNVELGKILQFGRPRTLLTRKLLADSGFIKTVYKKKNKKGYIKIESRTKISESLEEGGGD